MSHSNPFVPPASRPTPMTATLHRHARPATGDAGRAFVQVGIEEETADGPAGPALHRPLVAAPTPGEVTVMAAHGIHFDGCGFRFAGFRHACLIDALHQSRRSGQGYERGLASRTCP